MTSTISDPSVIEGVEEFHQLPECQVWVGATGSPQIDCVHPAAWWAMLQCCGGIKFFCCNHHRNKVDKNWVCPQCKKERSSEWIKWTPL